MQYSLKVIRCLGALARACDLIVTICDCVVPRGHARNVEEIAVNPCAVEHAARPSAGLTHR